MPSIITPLLIIIFSIALIIIAVIFDRLARKTNKNKDSGHFWAFIVTWHSLFLALLLFYSTMITLHASFWLKGYHLYVDLVLTHKNIFFLLVFFASSFSWLFFTLIWFFYKREEKCLLGGISYTNKRYWVLIFAIILLLIVGVEYKDVIGKVHTYPYALWTSLLITALSLIGLAFSAGQQAIKDDKAPETEIAPLKNWAICLQEQGIELQLIGRWQQNYHKIKTPKSGLAFQEWLDHLGAKNIEPLLIEAVGKLVNPPDFNDEHYNQFVASVEHCGQIESVALASQLLQQRFNTTTLVICEKNQNFLKEQLSVWHPKEMIHIFNDRDINAFPDSSGLWIISGELLSTKMHLCDSKFLAKIGLIVWWDLQDYTGVLASNMWAISRRLYRLIRQQGRNDIRTLVFMYNSPFADAQQASFLQHILPQTFNKAQQTYIPRQYFNHINLYLLESESPSLNNLAEIESNCRHLSLVATQASIEGHWPTYLAQQSRVSNDEFNKFSDLSSYDEKTLKDQLVLLPNKANAFIFEITEQNILSLASLVAALGRNKLANEDINIGIIPTFNPYVHYLLKNLDEIKFSRFLISAKASTKITERHLLLALYELPETESQLQRNFLWDEKVIKRILNGLSSEGALSQEVVRFLNEKDALCKEPKYKSTQALDKRLQPLDTVGINLITVIEPTAGEHNVGVRMQIDPEHLTIKAYPRCIFYFQNQRYRIDNWYKADDILNTLRLSCRRENTHHHTWRKVSIEIDDIKATSSTTGIGNTGLEKCTVIAHYSEILEAVIEADSLDLDANIEKHPLNDIYGKSFAIEAFVIKFPENKAIYDSGIRSLCYALNAVLPVHLGVRLDAFEIIPMLDETLLNTEHKYETFTGLAIIDLYPEGIGLVHILDKDQHIIHQLFEYTRNWLNNCHCNDGCEQCVGTALALELCDIKPSKKLIIELLTHFI